MAIGVALGLDDGDLSILVDGQEVMRTCRGLYGVVLNRCPNRSWIRKNPDALLGGRIFANPATTRVVERREVFYFRVCSTFRKKKRNDGPIEGGAGLARMIALRSSARDAAEGWQRRSA